MFYLFFFYKNHSFHSFITLGRSFQGIPLVKKGWFYLFDMVQYSPLKHEIYTYPHFF